MQKKETEKTNIGKPFSKTCDKNQELTELLNKVDFYFEETGEIKATASILHMSPVKIKKLLITSGKLEYEATQHIQHLLTYGMKLADIQKEMQLNKSSINSYLPYSKVPYKEIEASANANRCDKYRVRKRAVANITDRYTFYQCLILFEGYNFILGEGEKFKYKIESTPALIPQLIIKSTKDSICNITIESILDTYEHAINNNFLALSEYTNNIEHPYIISIFKRFNLIDSKK